MTTNLIFAKKYKTYKVFMIVILCLIIISMQIMTSVMQSQALLPLIIPALPLIAEIGLCVAGLAVAAGVQFGLETALDKTTDWIWRRLSNDAKLDVVNSLDGYSIGDSVNISDLAWKETKEIVDGAINQGESNIIPDLSTVTYFVDSARTITNTVACAINANASKSIPIPYENDKCEITLLGDVYEIYLAAPDRYVCNKNGVFYDNYYCGTNQWSGIPEFYFEVSITGTYINLSARSMASYPYYWSRLGIMEDWNVVGGGFVLNQDNTTSVEVYGTDYVDSSATRDFVGEDDTRIISTPASGEVTEYIGMTYTDVQNPVSQYSDTWQGTFQECAKVGEYTFNGVGEAVPSMTAEGLWDGQWTTDAAGMRTWTGTYTDLSDLTWSGTAAEVRPVTETSWLEWIYGKISTGINTGIESMVGTLGQIKDGLWNDTSEIWTNFTGAIAGATQAMAADIAGIKANTEVQELDATIQNYNIPQLYILVLKVILAFIRLIMRALIYIGGISVIPADSTLLNPITISAIDHIKEVRVPIPDTNITFYFMFTSMIVILFAIAVIKRARKLYK